MEILNQLVVSSVWPKLFLSLILYRYAVETKKKTHTPILTHITRFVLIIILRDVVYALYPNHVIYLISDAIIFLGYHTWMRSFTGKRSGDKTILIIVAVFILMLLPELFIQLYPRPMLLILRIPLIVLMIVASVQFYQISIYNTDNAEILIQTRKVITLGFLTYHTVLLIMGETNVLVHAIVIPVSYFMHFRLLFQYNKNKDLSSETQIEVLHGDIHALFDFMRNIGNAISERIEIEKVLDYIVQSAVRNTKADGGAVLLIDDFEDILRVKACDGLYPPPYPIPQRIKQKTDNMKEYFEITPIKLGETILGEVAKSGTPLFIRDTKKDPRMEQNTHDDIQYISSIMVIPLVVSNRVLGVLSVSRRGIGNRFSDDDFNNIKSFADYTSLSLDNLFTYLELLEKKEMEREVGIAADIQQKLLPRKLPKFENLQLSAFSIPAKGVSGDYYDIMKLKGGILALVICDVAGKGVPASLVMIMIRSIIHLIAGSKKNTATIVTWINRGITGKIDIDHFATLSYLTYDPVQRVIEYSNAGHHPLLIYRQSSQSFENLDTDGLPLGIEANTTYTLKKTRLNKGDVICLYTDGIIEAMNTKGEQYGYERLSAFLKQHNQEDTSKLTKLISKDIDSFVGKAKQHDDQTLLLLKVV